MSRSSDVAKSPNDCAHDGIVRNSCRARRQMCVRHTWCLGFDPLLDSLELVMHRLHCVTNRGSSRLPRFDDLRQQTPPLKWVLQHALSLARCICKRCLDKRELFVPSCVRVSQPVLHCASSSFWLSSQTLVLKCSVGILDMPVVLLVEMFVESGEPLRTRTKNHRTSSRKMFRIIPQSCLPVEAAERAASAPDVIMCWRSNKMLWKLFEHSGSLAPTSLEPETAPPFT